MTEKWQKRERVILEFGRQGWGHRWYRLVPHLFVPYVSIKVLIGNRLGRDSNE